MELNQGLVCRRLCFGWPGQTADTRILAAVEAAFAPGTVSLITGATGAGKSTLLHLLAMLLRPTAGEVWADGQPVSRWPSAHRDRWRRQVGIVFQHLAMPPDLSVAENLLLPMLPGTLTWPAMQSRIRTQLERADLLDLASVKTGTLSGGQRQRAAIARAMVGRPRFLLADEPTAFQDDRHADRILARFADSARAGAVVIVCSHDPRVRNSTAIDHHFHLSAAVLTRVAGTDEAA
jgi:ABC-type lipoprotein export system ATPase subunit